MSAAQSSPLPAHIPTITTPLLPPSERRLRSTPHGYRNNVRRRRESKRSFWLRSLVGVLAAVLAVLLGLVIWDISSYGNCATFICHKLKGGRRVEDEWWRNQGPYAPFRSLGSLGAEKGLPRGCEVDQVTILHRHTARYPTTSAGNCILRSLAKIKNREVHVPRRHPELSFLTKADLELKDWDFDGLMDQGRKAAWISGRKIHEIYGNFLNTAELFTRSSGGGRVVETSGYWLQGFNGDRFKMKDVYKLPKVDLVLPEEDGFNNTLSVHSCPAFNALSPATPGNKARSSLSSILQPTLDRLNGALRPKPSLELDDLLCLADMCGYDSQARGTDWDDWSNWCGVFDTREWEVLGYGKDLSRWYDVGEGGRYGATMGAGYVNELIARLTDSEVNDTTITNRTLNADERSFPRGGRRLFVDFGHDNEMLEVLAAMGIKAQRRPLSKDSVPDKRTYVLSEIVPFGGKLTVERISCDMGNWEPDPEAPDTPELPDSGDDQDGDDDDGGERGKDGRKDYVRILLNDKVELIDHIACRYSGLIEHGLCEMEAFLESQQFASTDVDWNICYEGPGE